MNGCKCLIYKGNMLKLGVYLARLLQMKVVNDPWKFEK